MNLLQFFENKSILVTGGTGTIGSEIVAQLLKYNPKVIRILSNSENELWETKLKNKKYSHKLRFLLGDIRNIERIKRAMDGMDYVFNAAAIKHVPISEYNPMEAVTVNIQGLKNIIEAAIYSKVKKMIHISTDKAVSPTTVMGATKMIGERLCISRNWSKGEHKLIISCVRFGNVLGSRGSIIPLIKKQIEDGAEITLTGKKMRRFFMSDAEAVNLVLQSMLMSHGSEIFVLKMPCLMIKDLIDSIVEEYAPKLGKKPSEIIIKEGDPRPGEKFDEDLISPVEHIACYESEKMFVIFPIIDIGINHHDFLKKYPGLNGFKRVEQNTFFKYSTENQVPLSKLEIKKLLNRLDLL